MAACCCVWSHYRVKNPGGAVALSSAAGLSLERVDAETSEAGEVSRSYGHRLQFQHLEEAGIGALVVDIWLK